MSQHGTNLTSLENSRIERGAKVNTHIRHLAVWKNLEGQGRPLQLSTDDAEQRYYVSLKHRVHDVSPRSFYARSTRDGHFGECLLPLQIEHRGKSSSLSSLSPLSKAAQKMPTFRNACMRSRSTQGIACGKVVQNFYELTLDLGKDPSSRGPAQVRPSRLSPARGSHAIRSQGSDALVPLQSIIAETFFAMSATCMRSPIDLQAVNGCRGRPARPTLSSSML